MRAGDTIVAQASGAGHAWRAMVRVSGPRTRGLLEAFVAGASPQERGCGAAVLSIRGVDGAPLELAVLVARFVAPSSYTGEESAEIQLPGNPALAERVLAAMTAHEGVRLASPGEFTARAYLGGRLTLAQAEGVGAAIAATTGEQLDAARALMEGQTGREYQSWAEELTTLLALVEAGIDFTDQEDVVAIAPAALGQRLDALMRAIGAHLGHAAGEEASGALPRVALVGKPNAGKSTLFNALLGRGRAVTSPVAGTTRDVLVEELDLTRDVPGAGSILLEDVAGFENAGGGQQSEAGAQAHARKAAAEADLLVWCDPTGRFDDPGTRAAEGALTVRVRTFGDRAPLADSGEDLAVCALDGWNLGELRRVIAERACGSKGAGVAALLPRHRQAVAAAGMGLGAARALVGPSDARLVDAELIAGSLREALDAMAELVGNISPDDVLGRVFATFCVGK